MFDLVTLTLKFDLPKTLTLVITYELLDIGLSHFTCVFLVTSHLSHHTIIFDFVTLTLKVDLLFKNFNLGHNILTFRDRAFIFHMCIPSDKTFTSYHNFLPSDLDLEL